MFMHNPNVQIADALFENFGRTDATREVTDPQMDASGRLIPSTTGNDRGRYALHFHRCVPDPTKQVRWGLQSTDEMSLMYFGVIVDAKSDAEKLFSRFGVPAPFVD